MKNKKGFTLVELLITITLMLLILVLAIINFNKVSKAKKEDSWELVKKQSEAAAKDYFETHKYYLESVGDDSHARVSIGKLVEEDFLNVVINPTTGKKVNECDYVEVTTGSKGYTYKYTQNEDNSKCNVNSYVVVSEVGAPKINVDITAGTKKNNNYYVTDVDITATVETGGNGAIKSVKYCTSSEECTASNNLDVKAGKKNNYTVTNYSLKNNNDDDGVDGNKVTTYFAATNTSDKLVIGSVTYKKDTKKPVCGTNNGTTTWAKDKRTITQACTDETSRCIKDNYIVPFTNTTRVGKIQIEDNAGNTNNCSVNVYVDSDAPICGTATGQGSTSNWTNTTRKITQTCSDGNGSGCNSVTKTFDKEATTKTITVRDGVGHFANCTVGVYIDKTKPSCTNVLKLKNKNGANYKSGNWATVSVYTSSNCSDSLSGCSGAKKITTTGATTNVTKKANEDWTVHADGTSYTTWYVYDKAGNEKDCSTSTIKKESSVTLTFDYNTTNNAISTSSKDKVFNTNYSGIIKYGNGSGNCLRKQGSKYVGCSTDDGDNKYYFGRSCMNIGDFIRSFTTNSVSGATSLQYGGKDSNGKVIQTSGINHSSTSYSQYPTTVFNKQYKVPDLNNKGSRTNFTIHEFSYTSPAGNTSNKVLLYTEYSVDCGY